MKQLLLSFVFILSISSSLWAANLSGSNGVHKTQSAIPLGKYNLGAQAFYHWAPHMPWARLIYNHEITRDGAQREIPNFTSMSGSFGLTYGVSEQLDLGFVLPGYWDQSSYIPGGNAASHGALQISAKWAPGYAPSEEGIKKPVWAALVTAHMPTGKEGFGTIPRYIEHFDGNEGSPSPLFGGKAAIDVAGLVTHQVDKFLLHGNLGVRKWFAEGVQAVLYYGATAEWLVHKNLTPFVELQKENRFDKVFTGDHFSTEPLSWTFGTKLHDKSGFNAQLGYTWNNTTTYQTFELVNKDGTVGATYDARRPVHEFFVGIGWQGALFKPTKDKDKDGVADAQDACPEEREDKDGFEDKDGCPDLDNDNDGFADAKDQCPDEAEDKDGYLDEDGCPELDNDNDGFADKEDKCPFRAGTLADQGCPEDMDEDGIANVADACPEEAGPEGSDGCPLVSSASFFQQEEAVLNLQGIQFKSGSSELEASSFDILDPIAKQLKKHSDVRIEIQGHTDSQGSESYNQRISERRAKSVRDYFISQGVAGSQMQTIGYGESQPIESNATKDGRAKNRRIEMKRLN